MVAIIDVKVAGDRVHPVAEAIAAMDETIQVYSLTGRWDLLVVLRVDSMEELERIVAADIRSLTGVLESSTAVATRVYAPRDVDNPFGLGMEKTV